MAEFESSAEFDDELLSAYLDDELSAEERARVEERLASDGAAAAMLEELRAASGAMRALPREKLSRDLRASVLAEIGRPAESMDGEEPQVVRLPYAGDDRFRGVRRGLVWSALAIAASLLLMALQPQDDAERPVAQREDDRPRTVRPPDQVPSFHGPMLDQQGGGGAVASGRGGGEVDGVEAPASVGAATPEALAEAASEYGGEDSSLGGKLSAQAAATPEGGAAPSERAVAQQKALPDSGSPDAPGGAEPDARSFAGGPVDGGVAPRQADGSAIDGAAELQVVEVTVRDGVGDYARVFERVLAETGVALNEEPLATEAIANDEAKDRDAGETILVEATPEQLKQILTRYRGEARAVNRGMLSDELAGLVRDAPAGQGGAAPQDGKLEALAAGAARAADQLQLSRRAGRQAAPSAAEAWRISFSPAAEGAYRRIEEAPVRVAPGAPAVTSASPAASNLGAPAAGSAAQPLVTSRGERSRSLAVGGKAEVERVRVLFVLRPAADAAETPAEE